MLIPRILKFLVCKLLECPDHAETGVARLDDIIDIAIGSCIVRVAEEAVLFLLLFTLYFKTLLCVSNLVKFF